MANDLLDAARSLRGLIDTNARANPDGPVPKTTMDALVEAGIQGVNVPRELGGAEQSMSDCIDVFAEVSRADGSAGWSLMASTTTIAFFAAYGGETLVEKMFADGVPLGAGQFAPNGTAVREGDGWLIDGDYQFGSGIDAAQWVGAGAMTVPEEGSSEDPDILFGIFPAARAERKGNWNVLGLRATASEDYSVRGVHIDDDAAFRFFSPVRRRGGSIYELGVLGLTCVGHAGWAIGVVRRALDELKSVAKTKHRMGAATSLAYSERFLHELGSLEARARAGEAFIRSEFDAGQDRIEQKAAPDDAVTNALRAATVQVTQDGAEIVRSCYLLAGTTALREGPLETCFRDIHAGSQHFFASPAGVIDFGRDLLAAAPENSLDAE